MYKLHKINTNKDIFLKFTLHRQLINNNKKNAEKRQNCRRQVKKKTLIYVCTQLIFKQVNFNVGYFKNKKKQINI